MNKGGKRRPQGSCCCSSSSCCRSSHNVHKIPADRSSYYLVPKGSYPRLSHRSSFLYPCEWNGDDSEGSISDFYNKNPILVWRVDAVVREGENLDGVFQRFDSSDEYPNAWASSGEREGFPAEQVQGIGVGGFASFHAGLCRVDYSGCVGIGWFVMSGMMIFLVFRHLEP